MTLRSSRTLSADLEAKVTSAALAILNDQGLEGLTVRALAERAEVSPMSIYNNFGDKAGVLDRLLVQGFSLLRSMADTSLPDPYQNLLAGANAYRTFALTHRAHYRVMFIHPFVGYQPSGDVVAAGAGGFEVMVQQVEAAKAVGYFAGHDTNDVVQQLLSAVHGYVSLELLNMNFSTDRDATFAQYVHAIIAGLSPAR